MATKQKQESSMEEMLHKFISYKKTSPKLEKEFEIRFGTKGKALSRDEFDETIRNLLSIGFKNVNGMENGEQLLRILTQYKNGTSINNIRTEIKNNTHIQYYCIHNRIPEQRKFVVFQKKMPIVENGVKVYPYNNSEFNFRASFQVESTLHHESPIIQSNLLETWESLPKAFRLLNRIEFVHPDYPLKCHLSIVKSSDKNQKGNYGDYIYHKSIKNVDLFNKKETYEIEIEVDEDMMIRNNIDHAGVMQCLRKTIKSILCGIQRSRYPIPVSETNAVMKSYQKLAGIPDSNRFLNPKHFCGPSSITLQQHHLNVGSVSNILTNYTVTDKADGERRLMYISETGRIYLIDTNLRIIFTGRTTSETKNTLLDGELITHDKFGNFINRFAAFDVYFINNVDKRSLIMTTTENKPGRLQLLEEVIRNMKNEVSTKRINFDISVKQFYYGDSIFEQCKAITDKDNDGLFPYETDGLIFTPSDKPVPIHAGKFTWNDSFKWKPPQFNTIDFLISYEKENGVPKVLSDYSNANMTVRQHMTLNLMCGFDEKRHGYLNPARMVINGDYPSSKPLSMHEDSNSYRPHLFYPTNPYDGNAHICNVELIQGNTSVLTENGEPIADNTIVEFRYDATAEWKWKPLRVRYDKTRELKNGRRNFGNDYTVANSNWTSIHNPVTEQMITSGANIPEINDNKDDVYYNPNGKSNTTCLRDFHNYVVKSRLIQGVTRPGDTLIDLAVGKGGDFPKWIKSKLKFVFGVDKSGDNIENRIDGAYARYLNFRKKSSKTLPSSLFIQGDSSEELFGNKSITKENDKNIFMAIMGKGMKDKSTLGKNVFEQYGIGKDGFSVCSCQFAIHYFFESVYSLENFIQNVINVTSVGGYFIGTSYDGKRMFDFLTDVDTGSSKTLFTEDGDKIWEVTKQYNLDNFNENTVSSVGYGIDIYQDSINKTFREFLVNYEYFDSLMERFGFRLLNKDELAETGLSQSRGNFEEMFNAVKKEKNENTLNIEIGKTLNMTEMEKKISFLNTYFVYKKIRHEITPVKLMEDGSIELK